MREFDNFVAAIDYTIDVMKTQSRQVSRGKWQGVDVSKKPDMTAFEVCYHGFIVNTRGVTGLQHYRDEIKPNLPWADNHFAERVCGRPINPGVEWANWPWGKNAANFLNHNDGTMFDHNYMERYWPKHATERTPTSTVEEFDELAGAQGYNQGYRYHWGDLNDVIEELRQDPTTRQAILPIFFPEDTGYRPGRRKPCSLFYQFQMNNRGLDIVYYLRSCDLVRHFRDDIYLTIRLLLWVLDRLREKNRHWFAVTPGHYVMLIGNLHCFKNDAREFGIIP